MRNISKAASLIQTYLASFTGIICLGVFGGILAAGFGCYGCYPQPEKLDFYAFIWLAAAMFLLGWVAKDILFPKIKREIWRKAETFSAVSGNYETYEFCSTHPSYVLLDILLLPPFYVLYFLTANDVRCTFIQEHIRGTIVLLLAIALPVFRLFSWYVLHRRISSEPNRKNTPKSLIPLYLVVAPIFLILFTIYIQTFKFPQWFAPVVDGKTFVGGINRHPEFKDKVVHLKGIQKSEPFECNKFNGEYACATVLVDLDEGGEVLVKICGDEQQDLVKQTEGKTGKPFEIYGKLVPVDAKQKDLCGIETLGNTPASGRYLLEVEYQ